jgi:hypothetical protein
MTDTTRYEYRPQDLQLPELETESLQVWIRKPTTGHHSWWLCFHSTDRREVWAWNDAVKDICYQFNAFQQMNIPVDHHRDTGNCLNHPHDCAGVAHCWEMLGLGHHEAALTFNTITEVLEYLELCGEEDTQLTELKAAAQEVAERARMSLAR